MNNHNIKSSFVRKRGNNYNVYIEYIDEKTIKKKQKSQGSFKKKKDAEKLLIEIKNAINNNSLKAPTSKTFVDRCYDYYNDPVKDFSPTTLKRSNGVIGNYVTKFFRDTLLSDINVYMYQKYINYLYSTNLKVSTIKEILNKTNAVLHECYRLKEIRENIPDFIILPKRTESSSLNIYTVEESKNILWQSEYFPIVEIPLNLFLLAGLRFGEMAGLLWEDIDFEKNTLMIRNNLVYVNGKYYLRKTKTDGSTRDITVPEHLMHLLKKEKIRQNKLKIQGLINNEHDVVCLNSKYKYWNNTSFTTAYKTFLNKINMRYVKLHSLRHSHATMLIASGTDMKTVSARLGHTDIKITLNIYSHILKEMDNTASNNIEKLLL